MGTRIIFPSLLGFSPRSEARIAFSMSPICETSYGWMVIREGSGTCNVATWLIGIEEP